MKALFYTLPKWCYIILVFMVVTAFSYDPLIHELAERTQQKLSAFHGTEPASLKIKKCEIALSDEGFLRYRKYYISGKQEYYSLNLSRIKNIHYLGNTTSGNFIIETLEDDVIVQTYNDRAGNVDSMAVQLKIPLSQVEAEDLTQIENDMFEMKKILDMHN